MMKNSILCVSNLFFILFSAQLFAQHEQLSALKYNTVIRSEMQRQQNQSAESRTAFSGPDTLFLPFFDDFSIQTVWPSAERWSDSAAFVNYNFPINPPTLGVASFDGLNKEGNPYDNSNANAIGLCDQLTSKPVNLYNDDNGLPFNPSDSIFLLFQYQRKGRGDNPESSDSLVVQFLNPVTQQWASVWKVTGAASGDTVFNKIKISINDVIYRQNGFRFRFRNYGSKTGMLDLWHVDYVSLNKFLPPDFENIRDYAFVYKGISLLNNYSALPWKHFNSLSTAQQQGFVQPSTALTLRNNNDAAPFPIKVAGIIYDQYNNPAPILGGGGLNNIVVPLNQNLSPSSNLSSNSFFTDPTSGEQATFTAVYELGNTSGGSVDDYPQNDTMKYVQDFHNYYAFDDGSAELSYGVNGVGASLAYKFELLKPDTLRAVSMYFAQLGLSVTNQPFTLAVWTGTTGPAGAPLYTKANQSPNYTDSINGFYTYNTDPLYLPAGTFFFGFIQSNAVILNLGLDINTPADASRKFINTSGNWTNSQLPGMWMIRPVFSGAPLNTGLEATLESPELSVFPVPVKDILHIKLDHADASRFRISLTDLSGRTIIYRDQFSESVNVSGLAGGLYLLHLSDPVSGSMISRKILVAGK